MYLMRTSARKPDSTVESMSRRVAEKALWVAEGRRKASGLRRGVSWDGMDSLFACTG